MFKSIFFLFFFVVKTILLKRIKYIYIIYKVMKIKIYNPITEKESKIDEYGRTAKKIYKYMIEAGLPATPRLLF